MLAADSRGTYGDLKRTTSDKISRTPDGRLIGASGQTAHCQAFMAWLSDPPEGRGKVPKLPYDDFSAFEILSDGRIRNWFGKIPHTIPNQQFAYGSGADYALGAMAMGANATRAVEIAMQFDIRTGGDVLFLKLNAPASD